MTAAASRATCAIGDERTASRLVDTLSESFDADDVAVVAFEQPGGRWDVTLTVEAKQMDADGQGRETPVAMEGEVFDVFPYRRSARLRRDRDR